MFMLEDRGAFFLYLQVEPAWNASIREDPARRGFGAHRVTRELILEPDDRGPFPLSVDVRRCVCGLGEREDRGTDTTADTLARIMNERVGQEP